MKALNIYYRTLSRNKVFSLISIDGFSLSLAALVVAILTVSWQSWRAARKNPVEALRYE